MTTQALYERYDARPYIDYKRLFDELERGVDGPCTLALIAGEDSPPVDTPSPAA